MLDIGKVPTRYRHGNFHGKYRVSQSTSFFHKKFVYKKHEAFGKNKAEKASTTCLSKLEHRSLFTIKKVYRYLKLIEN